MVIDKEEIRNRIVWALEGAWRTRVVSGDVGHASDNISVFADQINMVVRSMMVDLLRDAGTRIAEQDGVEALVGITNDADAVLAIENLLNDYADELIGPPPSQEPQQISLVSALRESIEQVKSQKRR